MCKWPMIRTSLYIPMTNKVAVWLEKHEWDGVLQLWSQVSGPEPKVLCMHLLESENLGSRSQAQWGWSMEGRRANARMCYWSWLLRVTACLTLRNHMTHELKERKGEKWPTSNWSRVCTLVLLSSLLGCTCLGSKRESCFLTLQHS